MAKQRKAEKAKPKPAAKLPTSAVSATRWDRQRAEDEESETQRLVARRAQQAEREPVVLALTPENILDCLARVTFFDPRNIYHETGQLKQLYELDKTTATALLGVEVTQAGVLKYKFPSRTGALQLLMQYRNLLKTDGSDVKALDELLAEYRKRYAVLAGSGAATDADNS